MNFSVFSKYLERLDKTQSRIEITKILSELFENTNKDEIKEVVYLSLGILAPNYAGLVLNLAEKMMLEVISNTYNESLEKIKKLYRSAGDLGLVAEKLSDKNKVCRISANDVFNSLVGIAKDSGEGSQERKIKLMQDLLTKLDPLSARYVARIPVGRLRLGFSEKTVIDALSGGDKNYKKKIEEAYNMCTDIGYIAKLVKEGSIEKVKPVLGVPISPMLAQRLNSTSEMIKKMDLVSVEPKFDGLRIFIHYKKTKSENKTDSTFIRVFTRNMNSIDPDVFPELGNLYKYINSDEVILDTEAVGIDEKRETLLDFQKTISRRRKHDIKTNSEQVPLQFQVFDILLCDGKNLLKAAYTERRKILQRVVVNGPLLKVDENTITDKPEVIKELYEKYIKLGYEGVVVKRASGKYVSGRTGWNWVKMKDEEGTRGKLSDSVDAIVLGYTSGKGKRVGFGIGQFLVGVIDGDEIKTVTKVGTGLTDIQFKELEKRLRNITVNEKPKEYLVHKDLFPHYWVLPKIVVELAADEITVSPKHTAGLALRFPRLVRFRDDKEYKDATTLGEIKELFKLQKTK